MRPELEPYGQKHMVTPHMQKLADRSMLFERAYVQVAVCMPSRNALLFSRRPDTAKAWSISPHQWPRTCGGPTCGGNECGLHCGIKEQGGAGKLGVSLPMWFLQNGWYTQGCVVPLLNPHLSAHDHWLLLPIPILLVGAEAGRSSTRAPTHRIKTTCTRGHPLQQTPQQVSLRQRVGHSRSTTAQ